MNAIAMLQKKIDKAGGTRKAAEEMGIASGYLSEIMNRKRPITPLFAYCAQETFGINGLKLMVWQATENWRIYLERKGK